MAQRCEAKHSVTAEVLGQRAHSCLMHAQDTTISQAAGGTQCNKAQPSLALQHGQEDQAPTPTAATPSRTGAGSTLPLVSASAQSVAFCISARASAMEGKSCRGRQGGSAPTHKRAGHGQG